ncbi:MAG: glycerol-3-phosphate dehydrogenase, partial [Microbacterium sp.]
PEGPSAACGVTAQELHWGIAVEGALTIEDLLDRRTRLGMVPADREASGDAAAAAFERAGVAPIELG